MKYVCDAPPDQRWGGQTWFRIETEAEAAQESALMEHAVEKFFRREKERAEQNYKPISTRFIERDIGLAAHVQREMPLFLTLRAGDGTALVTAMLPPGAQESDEFSCIIVGPKNSDPYVHHAEAIEALGRHFGLTLDRERCFPRHYRRD